MGCSASKIDSEESVARCKARKRLMKQAVQYRHAFAAAHAAYTQSLKNTGAAIRQFGEGEAKDSQETQPPTSVYVSQQETVLPPPPPLPFSPPRQSSSLSRATSMPPITLRNAGASPDRSPMMTSPGPLKEQEEGKEYAPPPPPPPQESPAPPPPPPPRSTWALFDYDVFSQPQSPYQVHDTNMSEVQEAGYAQVKGAGKENGVSALKDEKQKGEEEDVPVDDEKPTKKAQIQERVEETPEPIVEERKERQLTVTSKRKTGVVNGNELMHVLRELDDQFMVAFESGKEVARMLEARKVHYHSNFADTNGILDHHAKVLRVMSWGRYSKTPLAYEDEEKETHASTLDKLLAWEKKLRDEVKAGEVIRIELERKSVQLKNQKKREEDSMTIDKTKALVKSLQTRYLVEFQAVDAASSEVEKLRDDYLHLQLVDLVDGLMTMWTVMFECHQRQYQLVGDMKSVDSSYAPAETNEFHKKNTLQLEVEINLWHQNFDKLVTTQKEYMNALYSWLRLSIIQIENESKDKLASPQKMVTPPVYHLCRAWIQALDHLPGNVALQALKGFANIIHELVVKQAEELKQKKRYESFSRELEKKVQSLQAYERKYIDKHMDQQVPDEKEELVQGSGTDRSPLQERKAIVEALRRRVDDEKEKYEKLRSQSHSMTLTSLQTGLPPVLHAVTAFARTCSEIYDGLHELTLTGQMPQNLQLGY